MTTCKECGFEGNAADAVQCRACQQPLSREAGAPKHTQLSTGPVATDRTPATRLGRQTEDAPISGRAQATCPKCHYPIQEGFSTCPECGHSSATPRMPEQKVEAQNQIEQPLKATRNMHDFLQAGLTPDFRLEPLNHRKLPPLESRNGELRAGRKDIDPQDNSISSAEHFRIYLDKSTGEWKLENSSSNQALFVQVQGTVTLQPGMVIQVGQFKLFQFNPEA